ncbi:MAG: UbiA-like polyprenyltransferase [Desulfosarcinaceae bacterium]|nr:UbiA-like polyprenyltransferase [Desulfosarcinaceae bacterium]
MRTDGQIAHILNFTKIEHTLFSLPLIITGAWMGAGGRFPGFGVLLLIVFAAIGARIFGMACNRILDRHIDAKNPRTAGRELPSGKMSVPMALGIAAAGLMVYLVACTLLGEWCLKLAVIPLIPLMGYSLLKRFTSLCHFGIGLCLALAPLGAFIAAAGHLNFSLSVLLFALFVFCWLSGADIIYAILDIGHDRGHGIHSLPARLGAVGAQKVAAGVHTVALTALVLLLLISEGGGAAWFTLALAASVFVLMYIPSIPVGTRFFPISTIAGIAGALVPMLA